jgi:hypothetical protein
MINPKVSAAGLAGAATVVILFVLALCGIAVPAAVASGLTTLLAFAAGYIKSDALDEGDANGV